MTVLDAFLWLGATPPGEFLKASTLAFAVVQSAHLLGLTMLGGTVLISDLAVLRIVFSKAQAGAIVRGLSGLFGLGLAVAATSGVLLVSAGPFKYYSNPVFPWKLGLLALALPLHVVLLRRSRTREADAVGKVLAGLSLALWLGVLIAGRWVGLI